MNLRATRLVGFEATALELSRKSGVSHYTAHLLDALSRQDRGWRLALLSSRPPASLVPANVELAYGWRIPNRSLWIQIALPRIVSRLQPHVCHFTNSIAPLFLSCPYAVTVYDMSLYLYPRLQPQRSLWLVRTILPAVTRRAAAVITISESSKKDIVRLLELPADKVHVIHGAAGGEFRMIRDPAELERAKRKYGLDRPFILSVSTLEPRKNMTRLVAAFSKFWGWSRHTDEPADRPERLDRRVRQTAGRASGGMSNKSTAACIYQVYRSPGISPGPAACTQIQRSSEEGKYKSLPRQINGLRPHFPPLSLHARITCPAACCGSRQSASRSPFGPRGNCSTYFASPRPRCRKFRTGCPRPLRRRPRSERFRP